MHQANNIFQKRNVVIKAEDGWNISITHLENRFVPKPNRNVLLVHGLAANKSVWAYREERGLAYHLANHGYSVWLADLRGHGASLPNAAPGVEWILEDFIDYDLPAFINYVFQQNSNQPIQIIGHSMGALLVLLCLGYHPQVNEQVSYHISISPSYLADRNNPFWVQFILKTLLADGVGWLTQKKGYAPMKNLFGHLENESRSFSLQLKRWAHQKDWVSDRDHRDFWNCIKNVSCKVDFLCSKGDLLWGREDSCKKLFNHCSSRDKRFFILENELKIKKSLGHYQTIMGKLAHQYTLPFMKDLLHEHNA